MKDIEDRMDAVICAYVAAPWWFWGTERNQVCGTLEDGYIVVPHPRHAGRCQNLLFPDTLTDITFLQRVVSTEWVGSVAGLKYILVK